MEYAKKSAVAKFILNECCALESDWRNIWAKFNANLLDESQVIEKDDELDKRMVKVFQKLDSDAIDIDEKLNKKCWEDSCKAVPEEYAVN